MRITIRLGSIPRIGRSGLVHVGEREKSWAFLPMREGLALALFIRDFSQLKWSVLVLPPSLQSK